MTVFQELAIIGYVLIVLSIIQTIALVRISKHFTKKEGKIISQKKK